jgi:hypothetical protein
MKKILHKIAHLLKWNYGRFESYYEGDNLMMSWVCSGCGERSDIFCCDDIIDRELKELVK